MALFCKTFRPTTALPKIFFWVLLWNSGCQLPKDTGKMEPPTDKKATVKESDGFVLKPEVDLSNFPKENRGLQVDVNLGQSPTTFLTSVWHQLKGEPLSQADLQNWLEQWKTHPQWRRIDLAVKLAQHAGLSPRYTYSDPWVQQVPLLDAPQKKVKRDLGAVCMFFFNCPDGVNGKMSWANNHAPGMKYPDPICKIQASDSGYYHPANPGFWKMELLDARHAGLQFLLLNTYGPDIEADKLKPLLVALKSIEAMGLKNTVKLGLFDDTWTWGKKYFSDFWKVLPDMADPATCAELLYKAKWKPFFSTIPREHWYLFKGRPMIYFYNGGTLLHRENSAAVFAQMKVLFAKDFGVEPYLFSDSAFIPPAAETTADHSFKWFSLDKTTEESTQIHKGISLTHAMVRWDATSRSNKEQEREMNAKDLMFKDDRLLKTLLNTTHNKDLVVIATWNDLGEGTGINRCYDYFWKGQWQKPSVFMDLIRRSQAGEVLD